jgi:hypothetical protein
MKKKLFILLELMLVFYYVSNSKVYSEDIPPIPNLHDWEINMIKFGAEHLKPISEFDDRYIERYVWYYDGIKVYYQIAQYTKDPRWKEGAKICIDWYRDKFIFPNKGKIGGWRLFPHGLYMDYMINGDEKSKEAILLIAKNGAFADRSIEYAKTSPYDLRKVNLSREVAYNINCYHVARDLGDPMFSKPDPYVDIAIGHLDIWMDWLKKSPRPKYPYGDGNTGFQPFMVGLTFEALIGYYEREDAEAEMKKKILSKIKDVAVLMFNECWQEDKKAFYYESIKKEAAPDLNLLICPAYAWLWYRTGDKKYLEMGDKLFSGGVKGAWLEGGKQFSQNYRWSFNFVKWRSKKPEIAK